MSNVKYATDGPIAIVTIDRPQVRNAVDQPTAAELAEAFRRFEADDALPAAKDAADYGQENAVAYDFEVPHRLRESDC